MIESLKISTIEKEKSCNLLPMVKETEGARVSLMYDSIRGYLELMALKKGYKILNHERYVSFISIYLDDEYLAKKFDYFRKIRNSANYYGKIPNLEEADSIIREMEAFLKQIKQLII